VERIRIPVGEFTFDALAAGPEDGELVMMLHGFPQTGYSYKDQLPALAAQGFRVVAPDQRGYSPGARPTDVASYAVPNLVGDVLGMASALHHERFHVVGHDWGAAVAWALAGTVPQRVRSLTALSTPHLTAFGRAMAEADSAQAQASSYFARFRSQGSQKDFLANDAAQLRALYAPFGPSATEAYLSVLGTEEALGAALNWYRASAPTPGAAAPPAMIVAVPTLYVLGRDDPYFAMSTAEASAEFVTGPYRFEVLDGVGHWILEDAGEQLSGLLKEHLANWRGR
jgi:pimeloyl-ACP methyl ester carboxylesterase